MQDIYFGNNDFTLKFRCPVEIIHSLIKKLTDMEYFVFIFIKYSIENDIEISFNEIKKFFYIERNTLNKILRRLEKKYSLLSIDEKKNLIKATLNYQTLDDFKNQDIEIDKLFTSKEEKAFVNSQIPELKGNSISEITEFIIEMSKWFVKNKINYSKMDFRKKDVWYTFFSKEYFFPLLSSLFKYKITLKEYLILAYILDDIFFLRHEPSFLVPRTFNNFSAKKFFNISEKSLSNIFSNLSIYKKNDYKRDFTNSKRFFQHNFDTNELKHQFTITFDNYLAISMLFIREVRRQNEIFKINKCNFFLDYKIFEELQKSEFLSFNELIEIDNLRKEEKSTTHLKEEEINKELENYGDFNDEFDNYLDIPFETFQHKKAEDFEDDD